MDFRLVGKSGFRVPVLSYGTTLFGDKGERYTGRGTIDVSQATRMVDVCLEHGANLFDTADAYSGGAAEQILGQAIKGRRNRVLISTKATFPTGTGPNDYGSSRLHLLDTVDQSLKRLGIDHIDLFQLHQQDVHTPVEETLATLDQLVRSGKIRYIGCSNFSGWHLMKSLAVSDRYGYPRYIAHQAYYSLLDRDYEWELMPLGIDQGVGAIIWSPLAWGRLTGKIRRTVPAQPGTRAYDPAAAVPLRDEQRLFAIVDVLAAIAQETGRSVPQVALNWLLRRPTVSSILIGARNEQQLEENFGAIGWALSSEQIDRLDSASAADPPYPIWLHREFPSLTKSVDLHRLMQ